MNAHCDLGPDVCFGCKCAYWRERGGLQVHYAGGQEEFHGGQTARETEKEMREHDARLGGGRIQKAGKGSRWV